MSKLFVMLTLQWLIVLSKTQDLCTMQGCCEKVHCGGCSKTSRQKLVQINVGRAFHLLGPTQLGDISEFRARSWTRASEESLGHFSLTSPTDRLAFETLLTASQISNHAFCFFLFAQFVLKFCCRSVFCSKNSSIRAALSAAEKFGFLTLFAIFQWGTSCEMFTRLRRSRVWLLFRELTPYLRRVAYPCLKAGKARWLRNTEIRAMQRKQGWKLGGSGFREKNKNSRDNYLCVIITLSPKQEK